MINPVDVDEHYVKTAGANIKGNYEIIQKNEKSNIFNIEEDVVNPLRNPLTNYAFIDPEIAENKEIQSFLEGSYIYKEKVIDSLYEKKPQTSIEKKPPLKAIYDQFPDLMRLLLKNFLELGGKDLISQISVDKLEELIHQIVENGKLKQKKISTQQAIARFKTSIASTRTIDKEKRQEKISNLDPLSNPDFLDEFKLAMWRMFNGRTTERFLSTYRDVNQYKDPTKGCDQCANIFQEVYVDKSTNWKMKFTSIFPLLSWIYSTLASKTQDERTEQISEPQDLIVDLTKKLGTMVQLYNSSGSEIKLDAISQSDDHLKLHILFFLDLYQKHPTSTFLNSIMPNVRSYPIILTDHLYLLEGKRMIEDDRSGFTNFFNRKDSVKHLNGVMDFLNKHIKLYDFPTSIVTQLFKGGETAYGRKERSEFMDNFMKHHCLLVDDQDADNIKLFGVKPTIFLYPNKDGFDYCFFAVAFTLNKCVLPKTGLVYEFENLADLQTQNMDFFPDLPKVESTTVFYFLQQEETRSNPFLNNMLIESTKPNGPEELETLLTKLSEYVQPIYDGIKSIEWFSGSKNSRDEYPVPYIGGGRKNKSYEQSTKSQFENMIENMIDLLYFMAFILFADNSSDKITPNYKYCDHFMISPGSRLEKIPIKYLLHTELFSPDEAGFNAASAKKEELEKENNECEIGMIVKGRPKAPYGDGDLMKISLNYSTNWTDEAFDTLIAE